MFRALARQRENVIVVADPRAHAELARAVRYALADPARARVIGLAGHALTQDLPDVTTYVDGLERVLQSVIGEPARARGQPDDSAERGERLEPSEVVERFYPYTAALLGTTRLQAARAALSGSMIGSEPIEPREFAVAVGERLFESLDPFGLDYVRSMCRYELLMHEWAAERDQTNEASDSGRAFDEYALMSTRFSVRGDFAIEAFEHDVEELAQVITKGDPLPTDACAQLRAEHDLLVLFRRGSFPQKISKATAALLFELRDRSLSAAELHGSLSVALGMKPSDLSNADLAGILQGLFWEGVIGIETDSGVSSSEMTNRSELGGEPQYEQET